MCAQQLLLSCPCVLLHPLGGPFSAALTDCTVAVQALSTIAGACLQVCQLLELLQPGAGSVLDW
jgi:hypothetical protein